MDDHTEARKVPMELGVVQVIDAQLKMQGSLDRLQMPFDGFASKPASDHD